MSVGLAFRRVVFYVWLAVWLCETISHPATLIHMTLWLNLQFVLWMSCDPRSDAEVAVLHTAAWGSMHSLAVGYPVLLYFVPGHFDGLDARQMQLWCDAKAGPLDCLPNAAIVRSFLLHYMPIILLHIDLSLNFTVLQQTHARLKSFGTPVTVLQVVAPAVLGLLQKEVSKETSCTRVRAAAPLTHFRLLCSACACPPTCHLPLRCSIQACGRRPTACQKRTSSHSTCSPTSCAYR